MEVNKSNVDSVVDELEGMKLEIERQVAVHDAQTALNEMVPYRLAENLELFRQDFPEIYEHYADYEPSGRYQLLCGENGEPNLFDSKKGRFIYGRSPFDDCRKSVDDFMHHQKLFVSMDKIYDDDDPIKQFHFHIKHSLKEDVEAICEEPSDIKNYESIPVMFMFGLGLGFHLGYLYERMTPVNLFVVEPNEEFFYYSLCVFDYSSLINYIKNEHLGINFYLQQDVQKFIYNVNMYLIKHAGTTLPEMAIAVYESKIMNEIIEVVQRDFASLIHTNGFFDDMIFGINHAASSLSKGIPVLSDAALPGYVLNKPVILVGNGPSLDRDISLLKKYQDRCIIVACGTAYSALCRSNIRADIYVAVERTLDVYDSLMEITEHREFFFETVCVAVDVVHPKVMDLFKHKMIVLKVPELMIYWLISCAREQCKGIRPMSRTNPLVSNLGLELVSILGFENIYLLGIDNGAVGKETHSVHSLYYDDNNNLKDKYSNMVLDDMSLQMPGNFVETVRTNMLFKMAARIMEGTVDAYSGRSSYYNCSNGMKIKNCKPLLFSELNWESYSVIDKSVLRQIFMSILSKKVSCDMNDIKNGSVYGKFCEILDQLYNDWEQKPSTRVEFILKEEYQTEHLEELGNIGLVFMKAVNSSLTLYFNIINKVLYHFQDEEKSIDAAYRLMRKYMHRFFEGCKIICAHVDEYEVGRHIEIYNKVVAATDSIFPE